MAARVYTNVGVLPNHTVAAALTRLFSFFFVSSLPEESALWFLFCFVSFFCFLIGWRTRLFQVLSFVATISLHNHMLFAENWGGVAIGALMIWNDLHTDDRQHACAGPAVRRHQRSSTR